MKNIKLIVVLFALLAFDIPPAEVKLQYSFKTGDQYVWTQTTKQTIKQSIMGMEQASENFYDSEFLLKVVEVTATGAKLESTFTKLKNTTKTPMGENAMDSNGAQDKMENKIFQAMLNKPFLISVTSAGMVEKIEGAENLWSGFKDLGIDSTQQKAIQESLEMMLGEESLKSSFQSAFVPYPDKKVKAGEKWTSKHDVKANFAMAIENTWNIVSFTASVTNVYGEGIYSTTDKEKTFDLPGGMKAKSDLSGNQAVKTVVDTKSGWPSKHEILVELKGTMTLLAGGMIPQDMEVPMEILSETTYLIKKK